MIGPISLLLDTAILAAGAASSSCELSAACPQDGDCAEITVLLQWSDEQTDVIYIDQTPIAVMRITEDTVLNTIKTNDQTWTITTSGPALLIKEPGYSGSIRPVEANRQIEVNLIEIPKRYVTFAEALAARRTYRGICEGLF